MISCNNVIFFLNIHGGERLLEGYAYADPHIYI